LLRSHCNIMLKCSSEVTVSDANQEDRIQIYESNLIPYLIKKLLLFLPFITIFIRRKYIIKQIINIVIIIFKSLNNDCIKERRNQQIL
jgi:hypothetical protein